MTRIIGAARFARRLKAIVDRSEVWPTLKEFIAPHGFHHLTVMRNHPDLPARLSPSIVYSDAPESFTDAFDRAGLGPDLPLIVDALKRPEPFSALSTRGGDATPEQRQVLAHVSASLDVIDGWTIPIACDGAFDGIVMVGGREPDMSPIMCSIMHLLAHVAYQRHEELANANGAKPQGLTAREQQCLHWVSLGKTDSEIGQILSISPRTVRFHVENAKQKLRAKTRVQAVAEVMKLEAIAA